MKTKQIKIPKHSKTILFSQIRKSKKSKNVFMNADKNFVVRVVGGETSKRLLESKDWWHMGVYNSDISREDFYDDMKYFESCK